MSIWSKLAKCVQHLDEPFRRSEIIGWFRRHHPEVLESSLAAHIQAATDAPRRDPRFAGREPLLTRVGHGMYVPYRPAAPQLMDPVPSPWRP